MSDAAAARMRTYCSEERVYEKLQGFIEQIVPRPQPISEPVAVLNLRPLRLQGRRKTGLVRPSSRLKPSISPRRNWPVKA